MMLYENSYLILIAAIAVDVILKKNFDGYRGFVRVFYWIVFLGWVSTFTPEIHDNGGGVNRAVETLHVTSVHM